MRVNAISCMTQTTTNYGRQYRRLIEGFLLIRWVHMDTGPRGRTAPYMRLPRENVGGYMGTSLIRNSAPLGPYSRPLPMALWWS